MTEQPYQGDGITLPESFAATLRSMKPPYGTGDPRLPAVLRAARKAGWTLDLLGHAMGVTGKRARQIALKGDAEVDPSIEIPTPPVREKPARRPPAVKLTQAEADELRALRQAVREAEAGKISEAHEVFLAELADHFGRGARTTHLAEILGVQQGTIQWYLAEVRAKQAQAKARGE